VNKENVFLGIAVVVVVLLGFGAGVVFTSASTGESDSAGGHEHGPDTHEHADDGEPVAGSNTPERPDVEELLEPALDSHGAPIMGDGNSQVLVDTNAQKAAIAAWVEGGGDLATDPVPSPSGGDSDWWFGYPEAHPGDPRWWLVFRVEHTTP